MGAVIVITQNARIRGTADGFVCAQKMWCSLRHAAPHAALCPSPQCAFASALSVPRIEHACSLARAQHRRHRPIAVQPLAEQRATSILAAVACTASVRAMR
jgi:hypothetical protein